MSTQEEVKTPRRLLVEALRSGEYEQTTGKLHDGRNGYCCLGVACVVFEKETGQALARNYETNRIEGGNLLPHKRVQEWLGLKCDIGRDATIIDGTQVALSELNDEYEFTFKQLADIIETNDDLFVEG